MRRIVVVAGIVLAVLALGRAALIHVGPGTAAWQPGTGEWLVVGSEGAWVPRWRWSGGAPARLAFSITAPSREGANVTAEFTFSPTPGRYHLEAGRTAAEGAAAALRTLVEQRLGEVSLACIAGVEREGCVQELEESLIASAAGQFEASPGWFALRLVANRDAANAARRAALRERVGTPVRRVLVIGLDGADWEVLMPLVRAGTMPTLARLMDRGTYGDLATLTPILSPLIWTTMATGVGPAEHGILDFMEIDPESGATVPITGRQRKVPALWNMASAAGLTTVVSGWWATWPAEPIDGVMISDRLFFLLSDTVGDAPVGTVVYPATREPEMRRLAGRAEDETDGAAVRAMMPVSAEMYRRAVVARGGMADPVDGFRRILVGTSTYFGAALEAMMPLPDLTMVYCIGTDEIGHLLAPYLPPALKDADAAFAATARTAVERYHVAVDRWMGRLVERCPLEECAVLVVSDHGFKWGDDRPRQFSGTAAATAALWHRTLGVFVVAGNGIRAAGRVREPASVFDVAPTIAALLGLPADEAWPGTPLAGLPRSAGAVSWAALVPPESYRPQVSAAAPSPEYVAQLKALGYLEGGEGAARGGEATEGELNNLGLVHLEAGRTAEAEKAFRDAIARNPSYASPHYNLRRLYFEGGRFDEADAELLQAIQLGLRDSAGAIDRAATDYEARGRSERAERLLAEGVARFTDQPRLVTHRLALLVRMGRCREAAAAGSGARRRFPNEAAVHTFAGLAAACAGDLAAAREALSRSLALDPDQPAVREALATLD